MSQKKKINKPFLVHAGLKEEAVLLADWPLCHVYLLNDRASPVFILLPKIQSIKSLNDLNQEERFLLMDELAKLENLLDAKMGQKCQLVELTSVEIHQLHARLYLEAQALPQKSILYKGKDAYLEAELQQIKTTFDSI